MKKHVIVTGGSRGLGLAIVRRLLSEGYRVTSFSRTTSEALRELQATYPQELESVELDLLDRVRVSEAVQELEKRGPIFGLVNNAAQAIDGLFVSQSAHDVEAGILMNLLAPLMLTRLVARQMLSKYEGRIVNITSIAATRAYRGLCVYSAAKAGLEGFTRSLAQELGARRVTVNGIAPGFLDTDMTAGLSGQQRERIRRRTPLDVDVSPDDVANLVSYLLSPAAAMITGEIFRVDAGASL